MSKPTVNEDTKEFLKSFLNGNFQSAESDVMDNLFEIGAYYSWGEDNYGKHCRDNTVYGFLSTLEALVKEVK